jgi:hypothetical protein
MNHMKKKPIKSDTSEALARHARKCTICRHPDREDIEQEFLHWSTSWYIQEEYGVKDARSIYCHARATGLIRRRRENLLSALDNIVVHSGDITPSADAVLRAIRAYSCLDECGRWTDPPSRVVFSASRAGQPEPFSSPGSTGALNTINLPAAEAEEMRAPRLAPDPRTAFAPQYPSDIPPSEINAEDKNLISLSRLESPVSD